MYWRDITTADRVEALVSERDGLVYHVVNGNRSPWWREDERDEARAALKRWAQGEMEGRRQV